MTEFNLNTPMKDIEARFPFSRVLLHAKFHLGGCSSCGFEPDNTLAEVAQKHSKDPLALVDALNQGLLNSQTSEISPEDLKSLIDSGKNPFLIDVREDWEFTLVNLSGSTRLQESSMSTVFTEAKERPLVVFICHHGVRSLNAAQFFQQNGVPQALSLLGGIDAYALRVDAALARY